MITKSIQYERFNRVDIKVIYSDDTALCDLIVMQDEQEVERLEDIGFTLENLPCELTEEEIESLKPQGYELI